MSSFDRYLMTFLASPWNVLGAALVLALLVLAFLYRRPVRFVGKFVARSLLRNPLRTALTGLAIVMLVFVVNMVWSVLDFLDKVTESKGKDLKAIVTERWQIPSQMPFAYAADLARGGAKEDDDVKVQDAMTWQFYGGTLDPANRTRENIVFFFGMQPSKLIRASGLPESEQQQVDGLQTERKRLQAALKAARNGNNADRTRAALADATAALGAWERSPNKGGLLERLQARKAGTERELARRAAPVVERLLRRDQLDPGEVDRLSELLRKECSYVTMMDGLDEMTETERRDLYVACLVMEKDRRRVVVGRERLAALNKKVGERFTVSSFNYKDIDLEVEVLGAFPDGRYNQSALINRAYINDALDDYKKKNKGEPHPMANKTLNLVWLRVPDTETFRQVAEEIEHSPLFQSPAVKVETASSGIASFLDAYRDLVWGVRWLLVPILLATMALVIANAIGISVRERRTELAVLKVLGFAPWQILVLVLGEAALIGCASGLLSAAGSCLIVNKVVGGIKFPIAFFPAFYIPSKALAWGFVLGGLTALAGSVLPAWSARSVKVAEVFSKIA
jgi:putative ABC transport system permease protein